MMKELDKIRKEVEEGLRGAKGEEGLREVEVRFLGRKGRVAGVMKMIPQLAGEERKEAGKRANELKGVIEKMIGERRKGLEEERMAKIGEEEWVDPTLPGERPRRGRMHPISAFVEELREVFGALGFEIAEGGEIEDDYHNFTALNIPDDHPARDSQDTFFLRDFPQNMLRTQTSAMQIRWCETHKPPVRIIAPGKCFRKDELDATHSPIFHQFEGLMIDEGVNLSHLKGVISESFKKLLGEGAVFRFRTSYFPFVEPGLEVDARCTMCEGKGCRICKEVGWMEVCGCGMVHPNVLKAMGYDASKYTGLAFGAGIERMLMSRYKVPDIRYFYENDLRFLEQF